MTPAPGPTRDSPVARWKTAVRALPLADLAGLALAFVYGLPTLAYGFGRDQGLFYYLGREWLAGRIPYRDAFDVKPPGIYLVYAVAIRLFGPHLWSVRLLELLGVLTAGYLIALCVRR